jgi:hypothetical protein
MRMPAAENHETMEFRLSLHNSTASAVMFSPGAVEYALSRIVS